MKITRWEPLREMEDLFRAYSPVFGRRPRAELEGSDWTPAANISETDAEYLVKTELPGVKKEDVKVTVDDGVVTIAGERRYEKEQKEENTIRVESFFGTFSRSFLLPDNVDANSIRAENKDGMLCVHIPKTKASKPKALAIEVK